MKTLNKYLNRAVTGLVVLSALLCLMVVGQTLANRQPSVFGFRLCRILSGSMEPTLREGSLIVVRETDADSIQVGDIITFTSRESSIYGKTNTHRVIAVEETSGQRRFVTKGDANRVEDSQRVNREDLQGKVVLTLNMPAAGSFLAFLITPQGFFTVIVLPMLLMMFWFTRDFSRRLKELKRQAAEEAEGGETESGETESEETESGEAESEETESGEAESGEDPEE